MLIKYYLFKIKSESLSIFSNLTDWKVTEVITVNRLVYISVLPILFMMPIVFCASLGALSAEPMPELRD